MAYQADGAVVIAQLKVAFLRMVMMIDFVHVEGHLPISHILLQVAWRTSTTG